jgi:hypothetical protein
LIGETVTGFDLVPKPEFVADELRKTGYEPKRDRFWRIYRLAHSPKLVGRFDSRVEGGIPLDDDHTRA